MWNESIKKLVKTILLMYKTILIEGQANKEDILDELTCDVNSALVGFKEILPYYTNLNVSLQKIKKELKGIYEDLYEETERIGIRDPAVTCREEVILCYPYIKAIILYRIAHFLYINKIYIFARTLSEEAHSLTGIDIHPGAEIGKNLFIDHGTGVVIGETCIIGNNVTIYQGVTLGTYSFRKNNRESYDLKKKRHPTIEDNVTIYANATILGGETIIGENSIIGSNAWIASSVLANSTVKANSIIEANRAKERIL